MSEFFQERLVNKLIDRAIIVAPTFVATALFGPPGLIVGAAATAAILAAGGNNSPQPPAGDQNSR
jgi:hypothetical protein